MTNETASTKAAGLPDAIAFEVNLTGCSVPQDFHQFAQSCAALANELRNASKKLFPGSRLTFAPHGNLGENDWAASAWLTQLFLAEVERRQAEMHTIKRSPSEIALPTLSPADLQSAAPPPEPVHKSQTAPCSELESPPI